MQGNPVVKDSKGGIYWKPPNNWAGNEYMRIMKPRIINNRMIIKALSFGSFSMYLSNKKWLGICLSFGMASSEVFEISSTDRTGITVY